MDGTPLTPSLYTGVVTDENGKINPISKEEWSRHWKNVAKGKAPSDSGVTTDMLRLAHDDVLESYRDIANATLQGGCIPDTWKGEIMFPAEKIAGTEKFENTGQSCSSRRAGRHAPASQRSPATITITITSAQTALCALVYAWDQPYH